MASVNTSYALFVAPERRNRGWLYALVAAVTILGLILLFGFDWQGRSHLKTHISVRAIDSKGHPVAGAGIYLFDHMLGITDSFGEWSRAVQMDLSREQALVLNVRKQHLAAKMDVILPDSSSRQEALHIKKTLQLKPSSSENY